MLAIYIILTVNIHIFRGHSITAVIFGWNHWRHRRQAITHIIFASSAPSATRPTRSSGLTRFSFFLRLIWVFFGTTLTFTFSRRFAITIIEIRGRIRIHEICGISVIVSHLWRNHIIHSIAVIHHRRVVFTIRCRRLAQITGH